MTKQEFLELTNNTNFSTQILADKIAEQKPDLRCNGRLCELKVLVDYDYIANYFGLDVEELKRISKEHINWSSIYDFMTKYEIDIEALNIEECFTSAKVKKSKLKVVYNVGDEVDGLGKVQQIVKVGSSCVYVINGQAYTRKEVEER